MISIALPEGKYLSLDPGASAASIYPRCTGAGKTELIKAIVRQCIKGNSGFSLFDPHGDLYFCVLEYLVSLVKAGELPQTRTT